MQHLVVDGMGGKTWVGWHRWGNETNVGQEGREHLLPRVTLDVPMDSSVMIKVVMLFVHGNSCFANDKADLVILLAIYNVTFNIFCC